MVKHTFLKFKLQLNDLLASFIELHELSVDFLKY